MAFFDFLFDPGAAYRHSRQDIQRGFEKGEKYTQPYRDYGTKAGGGLWDSYQKLQDPQGFEDWLTGGYQTSAHAKDLMARNMGEGNTIAQSMGLGSSSAALGDIQAGAGQIMNEDEERYRNRLMQDYLTGIGIGQNMYNTGAQSANNLANQANQAYTHMADATYGAESATGNLMGQLGGAALTLGGMPVAGGGTLLANYLMPRAGIGGGR